MNIEVHENGTMSFIAETKAELLQIKELEMYLRRHKCDYYHFDDSEAREKGIGIYYKQDV